MKLALIIDITIDNFLGESLDIQTFFSLPAYHSYSICSQCTLSLAPENIRKPYGDVFIGYRKGALGTNWLIKN